jgi:serine/arginine repetitive matrix protein 2
VHAKPEVHTQPDLPHLTFTDAPLPLQGSASADATYPSAPQPFIEIKKLKNSASTPDLRIASNLPFSRIKRLPSKPSGFKDRWLSAETWCDAVLFPRPRLRVKQLDEPGFVASGRIVSPPGSPLPRSFVDTGIEPPGKGKGLASRVLVHSRSLADLKASMPEAGPSSIPYGAIPFVQDDLPPPERSAIPRPPRPKSFAQDDMSLVPSLAR